ncbi:MAG: EstA family serine hydrolase, partial [Rhodospirillales bacterium]|nr:EstA family serine hydrolase [Rhodospirillales bacterium]
MTEKKHTEIDLQGECALGFESVRDALAESFVSRDEIGSAICVYFEGKKVVDLWGGYVDGAQNHPWRANTLCLMYSVAKSICSLSVHMLADRGQIDLEAPIAEYWPEFAQAGKEGIKVRHFLSHWCGVWANDRAIAGDIYDPEAMEKVIAMQSPAWPIETQGAYNTVNIGFIANEIVRRVTDKSIQNFIADEITKPLGVDYYLGVPENALDRCAEIIANPADQVRAAGRDPDSPVVAAWKAFPKNFGPTEQNSYRFRTAGVPSFGGFGEARAMAKIYAVLAEGGELDGVRLLSSNGI